MNILSLFDGISCAREAFKRAKIPVGKYYASEVDKYAIQIASKNYPGIIQLGDVNEWETWNLPQIDVLIGGSPCQGFSYAGKQLAFEDSRSKLFFKYVEILRHYKPKYFILENVKMKKEFQDIISGLLKVEPVEINSNLVSAQNRKRLYWCNFPVSQPQNKGIVLRDIIENGMVDREKSHCIDANFSKGANIAYYKEKSRRQLVYTNSKFVPKKIPKEICAISGVNEDGTNRRATRVMKPRKDGKSNSLSLKPNEQHTIYDSVGYRKLTPVECERLQTLPDNYTEGVSNTQRYKCLGNSFTCEVIVHILGCIKKAAPPQHKVGG